MKIPSEKFDEIAQANDIIDVISGYIQVKKRGKSFLALCPFHPDKNPSLHITQEKQVYHCFSCKASGNVFSFVQNFEKITFLDAVQKLADRAGIELKFNSRDPDLTNEISKLFEINKSAAKYFYRNLKNLSGSEKEFVYNYLDKRKIDSKAIERFGIGYSSKNWDGLLNQFLEDAVFKPEDIEKAGLILRKEKDSGSFYDRFRGRLMFPIFNENDKVVGFGGRKLYEDDLGGKYINSPESKIYSKSKVLYGLNFAKEKVRYFNYVILVEGYMDLIALYKNGIENVVASSGTALTEEQVKLISRYTSEVYILFDSDLAGIKASKRGMEVILEAGLDLSVITLPEGEDPDSFMLKFGKDQFEKIISARKSLVSFVSGLYEKEGKLNSVNEKTEYIKEIISYIGKIPDKIKRALYIKEISKKYSLYESDMRDELEKVLKQNKAGSFPKTSVVIPLRKAVNGTNNSDRFRALDREVTDYFVRGDRDCLIFLYDKFDINWISNNSVKKIISDFMEQLNLEYEINISRTINNLNDEMAIEYMAAIVNDPHEVSEFESDSRHSLLKSSMKKKYNASDAKKLINRFIEKELEDEITEIKNNKNGLSLEEISIKISDLKKRINQLNRK